MLINNRYRVIRTLGEGGFGQAYLAEDTQMPSNRQCVIKQLKPLTTSAEVYQIVQERFQREAAILEKLGENHPQIPRLYAYFSENQKFYLVQEWIEGQTLAALVETQGRQSESVVCSILMALLPVLDFVHAQGIIHRDIKPENIILRAADANQPVLIDFGAVRETMGTMMNSHNSFTSSIVIGTPGYMAAEQAAGRPIPSSDLYSLGLVAIYLLTALPPQSLTSDPQTGEIIWRDQAGHVSVPLVSVIARAMRSHPRDRYSSANQMLTDLLAIGPSASSPAVQKQQNLQNQQNLNNQQNLPTVAVKNADMGFNAFNRSASQLQGDSAGQKSLTPLKMGLMAAAVGASVIGGGLWISNAMGDSTLQPTVRGAAEKSAQSNSERSIALKSSQGEGQRELELTYESEANAAADSSTKGDDPLEAGGNATASEVESSPAVAQYGTLREDVGDSEATFTACLEAVAYDPADDTVNLRDRPNGNIIASLPNLTLLQGEGPAGAEPGWNRVFVVESNTWGFVSGNLIYRTYYQVQDPQDTSANLRTSPNGEVIMAVPNGTEVQFLGVEGRWTKVQLNSGQLGYISTQLLSDPDCF
jgi:serine/threonine protein kinase